MATKYIGDITHGEKFTNKEGEEKTKWTNVGGLFFNEEKQTYSVKFLGQWLNVFPKKQETKKNEFGDDIIPF